MIINAKYALLDGSYIKHNVSLRINDENKIIEILENADFNGDTLDGILVPGFFNSHAHLELAGNDFINSDGLYDFIRKIQSDKINYNFKEIEELDKNFYNQGVVCIVDVCNSDITTNIKKSSEIEYVNLLEFYKKKSVSSNITIKNLKWILNEFKKSGLNISLTLHSCYALNNTLLNWFLKQKVKFLSLHFLESSLEYTLQKFQLLLYDKVYIKMNVKNILEILSKNADKILLVHGIYLKSDFLKILQKQKINYALCICPTSNLNIENKMVDRKVVSLLRNNIFLGTDSNLSNTEMSLLNEMFLFQNYYNKNFIEVINSVSLYPAVFFEKIKDGLGKINLGMKPGLNLLMNIDYNNFKITKDTIVKRIL